MFKQYKKFRRRGKNEETYQNIQPRDIDDLFKDAPPLKTNNGGVWQTFIQLVSPFKWLFILDMSLYLAATILNALLPFVVAELIDSLQIDFNQQDFSFTGMSMQILLIYLAMVAASTIFYRLNALVLAYFEPAFTALSRARLTDHTLARSVKFLSDKFAGRMIHAINEITRASFSIIDHIRWSFIEPVFTALILIATALTVHPYFSVLLVLWLLLYAGGVLAMTYGLRRDIEHVAQKKGEGSAAITDSVTNYLAVKMFASRKSEIQQLNAMLSDEADTGKKYLMKVFYVKAYQGVLELMLYACSATMIWYLWQQQSISVGQIVLIFRSSAMVHDSLWSFSSQMINFSQDVGSMSESIEQIKEVDKNGSAIPAKAKNFMPEKGEIVFNNLSFSYNKEGTLFKGLQLKVGAGERIGIVGHSGSGKSTLVKLLLRFYDVNDNEIVIDRQNISKLDPDSIRKNIAVIPQDANLFNRSVMENIRYGRLDATDEEVFEAAKKAHAHTFIKELEQGYGTRLGDRGVKLSGGQRQRIAIARAILKDTSILVLDEATSALDSQSEKHIQKALDNVMKGKTVIAIAHRLSTITHMDRIIVLDDGEVVEAGTHDELIKKGGRYAKLWKMQASSGAIKD